METEAKIQDTIKQAFKEIYQSDLSDQEIILQPTKKDFKGTYTFVTFPFGKLTKKKPQESAEDIGLFLKEKLSSVDDYNVVKGFLNLELSDNAFVDTLNTIAQNTSFGTLPDNGKKVMVEFSSPNTNKPLHLGHLRNNFLGDAVYRIMEKAGYEVLRTNLVNDRGIHICKSMVAYQKFGNDEQPSENVKGDHLVGKYYVEFDKAYKKEIEALRVNGKSEEEAKKTAPIMLEAQEMLKKWEAGDEETVSLWKKMNQWVYDGFDKTYKKIGISFDTIYHESDTYLLGKDLVKEGLEKSVFFKKEDGSVWADLTEDGYDEKILLRSDGTSVYITQDLGTADLKFKDFPFDQSIYVVGNEQDYHFAILFKILEKIGRTYAGGLHHLSYGMVDLPTGKMKSREGTVVDADDLIDEMIKTARARTQELGKIDGFDSEEAEVLYETLGVGALKYFLLKVDPKKRILFDPEASIEFQGNTGPFIQYTHARISAILRKAKTLNIDPVLTNHASFSISPVEKEIIFLLSQLPGKIFAAASDYSPSIIAQYAYDVAKEYNRFYQELPIFSDQDNHIITFRVLLSSVTARIIKLSMNCLGINVPDRM
ncbi:MAG TPA: arginine--tRNA ligase [Cyclobacteriaceae bacterium]